MEKGLLRIYFGYSAGVGKTYKMLEQAQEQRKNGVDIVIGYLEPHNRPETQRLAIGIESIPLKNLFYKEKHFKEFDVDAAIARHPQILLVDEFAHTNIVGSKNKKRSIDIEEILNHGIDVWTTINVQHLESLHDLIDSATSVNVNERIADELFDYADEVVLVDVEPEMLIQRMKEGKIYQKTQAMIALDHFFTEENLSILREVFMRKSADRIEKRNYNRSLKTRILVLISPSPSSEKNIHVGARMAEAYHCRFSAMYVEKEGALSDESAAYLKKNMALVRDLGGDLVVKYGEDVVETVSNYVHLAGVTHLVIGKTWKSIGKKIGLEEKIILSMPEIEILIVPDHVNGMYMPFSFQKKLQSFLPFRKKPKQKQVAIQVFDIVNLILLEALQKKTTMTKIVASVLARAFNRPCAVFAKETAMASFTEEQLQYFQQEKEQAVYAWCKKNRKQAGKGTDTLREAKAIYFPIETNPNTVVISFFCMNAKMSVTDKLLFYELETFLRYVFSQSEDSFIDR